jgi:predicted adenine nucleotide alpha hydrolase (AANH) superfamily ATPase
VKKALIHSCCAHCASYTVDYWQEQGYEVTAYWYNPNIHPVTEHNKRLDSMRTLVKQKDIPLLVEEGYEYKEYFDRVAGDEENRCYHCFKLRLGKTAKTARENGFDAIGTTLLISPHQKHDLLKEIGRIEAESEGVEFLYTDLRKRYSDSRHTTKPMKLYCQRYCGCAYSKWEL